MSPCCSLTVLQPGVDWQDTPKDVFKSILKLIGFVMLFIDQVFPNCGDYEPRIFSLPLGLFFAPQRHFRRCPTVFRWHVTGVSRRLARGWFCACRRLAGWWAGVC